MGNSNVNGSGTLKFTRKGNTIEVMGEVLHSVRDDFTFTSGRVNHFPFGEKLFRNDMLWLQANGRAKPFTTQSTWRRSVVARLRIERDSRTGKERIVGFVEEPRWSDLK